MSAVESVCPPPEELEVKGVAVCQVEGCGREFPSSSHLQMHVARHHEGRKLRGRGGKRLAFYCPVGECERREGGGKPFPRLGELKQHFQSMHGKREFVCRKCSKRFKLGDACRRHEAECGQTFACGTCMEIFRSRNALYQHTKRKHHTLPPSTRSKPTKPNSGCTPLLVVPLVLKQVIQLPREESSSSHKPRTAAVDAAIQTEPEAMQVVLLGQASTENEMHKAERTLGTVAEPVPPISPILTLDHSDLATQTDSSTELLSFSTQTMSLTTSHGCQTQPFACRELSTQTYQDPTTQHTAQFSLGTQTQQDLTQSSLGTQTQQDLTQSSLGAQTQQDKDQFTQTQQDLTQFSLGTQTQQDKDQFTQTQQDLTQFSLGTQTQDHDQFSLGTQTQPLTQLTLGTQTQQDHDQFSLGTQTQDLTQFNLGTQTHQDLTQFTLGTQTQQDLTQFTLGTQTHQDLTQFTLGTQTHQDLTQFTLGTQTLTQISLGTQTHQDLTQFTLGTQTQQDFTEFSLCDFGTQTVDSLNLVEQVLGATLLPPECMDFGTQTRESSLDDMACLDFGALLQSRTTEHGCQT